MPLIRGFRNRMQPGSSCCIPHAPFTVARQLHCTPRNCTDGVYKDLTNMRVRTPWIEALRRRREEEEASSQGPAAATTPANPVPKAKKMSDSFHRVVRCLPKPHSNFAGGLTDVALGNTVSARSMASGQLPQC